MKTNEYDYYNEIGNWSFDDIKCISENFTNWIFEDEIKKHVKKDSNKKILWNNCAKTKIINNNQKH